MYRIKIQEGKDLPKDANGKLAFPSKFEGENPNTGRNYTKTSIFMCEMTVPLRGTGGGFNGQWILCDSGNPPLVQARCVWSIAHQEAKVLAKGVTRGTD